MCSVQYNQRELIHYRRAYGGVVHSIALIPRGASQWSTTICDAPPPSYLLWAGAPRYPALAVPAPYFSLSTSPTPRSL